MAKPTRHTSRPATPPAKASATKGLLLGGGVLLVVLVVLAVILAKPWEGSDDDADLANAAPYRDSVIEGAALPAPVDQGADPAVGMTAPTIKGATFNGDPYEIAPDGKPRAIVFYAHWCEHCRAELPRIVDWMNDNKDTLGVKIEAIATATSPARPNFPPAKWFNKEGYKLPVVADDQSTKIANAFGLKSYPYFVFLDKDHKVVARASGEITMSEFEGYLKQANP